jgi:hypothetical protein
VTCVHGKYAIHYGVKECNDNNNDDKNNSNKNNTKTKM